MNSRHQPQTHPSLRPSVSQAFPFGNLLESFHSFCARTNKISPLAPSSPRSSRKKTNSFFSAPPFLSFLHSFRTRSYNISPLFSTTSPLFATLEKISPLFAYSSQKHPGIGGYIVSLPRKLRDNRFLCTPSTRVSARSLFLFPNLLAARCSLFPKGNLLPHLYIIWRILGTCIESGPDKPCDPGEATHATQFS